MMKNKNKEIEKKPSLTKLYVVAALMIIIAFSFAVGTLFGNYSAILHFATSEQTKPNENNIVDADLFKQLDNIRLENNCVGTIYYWETPNIDCKKLWCESKRCLADGFCKEETVWIQ